MPSSEINGLLGLVIESRAVCREKAELSAASTAVTTSVGGQAAENAIFGTGLGAGYFMSIDHK